MLLYVRQTLNKYLNAFRICLEDSGLHVHLMKVLRIIFNMPHINNAVHGVPSDRKRTEYWKMREKNPCYFHGLRK